MPVRWFSIDPFNQSFAWHVSHSIILCTGLWGRTVTGRRNVNQEEKWNSPLLKMTLCAMPHALCDLLLTGQLYYG
jgi:hypothetical protein